MKKIICTNARDTFLRQLEVGKEYYLDLSTVNGDCEGNWYGMVYADDKKEVCIGHLRLSHFKSVY